MVSYSLEEGENGYNAIPIPLQFVDINLLTAGSCRLESEPAEAGESWRLGAAMMMG
jgi:hypothetical protein